MPGRLLSPGATGQRLYLKEIEFIKESDACFKIVCENYDRNVHRVFRELEGGAPLLVWGS